MLLSNKHFCFLLIFVLFAVLEAAKNVKKAKPSIKSKKAKSLSSKFTVPLYFAARGPSVSAAEYLNKVYPGIRYAELSKTEHIDTTFATNITLGTPAQKLTVKVQTSGSGLWTYEKGCYTRFVGVNQPAKFYKKRSKTEKLDERLELHDLITDTFTIGKFTQERQQFVAATSQIPSKPKGFLEEIEPARLMNADGILSLGFPQEKDGVKPPLLNMLSTLKDPVFSIWIKKGEMCPNNVLGHLTIGGFSDKLCNTAASPKFPFTDAFDVPLYLRMTPKNSKWTVQIQKFFFDSVRVQEINLAESGKTTASIELGSSHIYAPRKVVEFVERKSGAKREAGILIVECNASDRLADFIFHIDGFQIPIPASNMIIDIGLGNNNCALAIDDSKNMDVDWVLGTPFMKRFCTIFDEKQRRIGLVRANDNVCDP